MKYVKLFEQFIKEDTMKPGEESEVTVDDITLEDGKTITSAEIVGVIVNSENEKQLEDYFFDKYGQNAFKQGELAEIKQKWNEWYAEQKEEEADAEKEEEAPAGAEAEAGAEDTEEGGDDIDSELADLENM